MWCEELQIPSKQIKEAMLKFANDHDVDLLISKGHVPGWELAHRKLDIKESKERTDHLIKNSEEYAKAIKEYDAIISFLNAIKPIAAERHAQKAGHLVQKHG